MTPQELIKEKLTKIGIPYKDIEVYGGQIVITSLSYDTAKKWQLTLSQFATIKGIRQSYDNAKENKNTVASPTKIKVWRTFATI